MSTEHLEYLGGVVKEMETLVRNKEAKYNGSWKARGGVGAFFVSARKYDALENMVKSLGYDVFAELGKTGDGTIEDTLVDIVGYGLLILSERRRLRVMQGGTPEDGGHHGQSREQEEGEGAPRLVGSDRGQLEESRVSAPTDQDMQGLGGMLQRSR